MNLERLHKEELILIIRKNLDVPEDTLVKEALEERVAGMVKELNDLDQLRIRLKLELQGCKATPNVYDKDLIRHKEQIVWKLEEVEQQILFLKCQYRRLVECCSDETGVAIGD